MNTINRFDTVIFDLDGTLLDTLGDLAGSVNFVLKKHGFPEISLDDTRQFVGNGVARLMELAVPDGRSNPLFETCLTEFGSHYTQHMEVLTAPYPGVMDLLETLKAKNIKLAVVSNKFDGAVKQLCTKYFGEYIRVAIGESPAVTRKPAPDAVYKALDELGADKDCAVYVGDSEVDIQTAKNAGLPCISVSWGFRAVDLLLAHGAVHIINEPVELLIAAGLQV